LRDYRVDGLRIVRELGFAPRYTVEDAFRERLSAKAFFAIPTGRPGIRLSLLIPTRFVRKPVLSLGNGRKR